MEYDAFISYARKDGRDHAERLECDLIAAGLKPWRDRRDMDPDQDFSAELEQGIENSNRVVCCITPDTRRENSFVRREIGYALAVGRPIVPLIFEDSIPPIHIINVTREDFTHVPWQQAFTNLLVRLCRREESIDQPLTPPADPFRAYLNALYLQIVDWLKHTVFSEIVLFTYETEGAADKRVRTALPITFWRDANDGLATAGARPESFQNFGESYSRYEGRVLLLGGPGSGKTTTLLAFARDRVAARLHDSSAPLPLLAQISTWDSDRQTSIPDWLASQVSMIDRETIASQIAAKNALLMLDGLDELGKDRIGKDRDHYDPRKRFVANVPHDGPVIITCRVNDYADIGKQIGLTGAVTLKQLTDAQICEYLAEMPALWQALQSDRDLCDVVRIPLLLSILTRAYQDNASELSTLSDLKAAPGTLREKICDAYIRSRFAHERRHGKAGLSFSIEEAYRLLGQAAIDSVNYIDGGLTEYGITIEESIRDHLDVKAASFIEQMLRFHFLVRGHAHKLIFIHSLLRDHFAFRYALSFVQGAEFKQTREYRFRKRALQFLAESGDERALEPLLEHVGAYVDFPLVYSLCFADPRVLLAYARTLPVDAGNPYYDFVSDAAQDQIKIVAKKLGAPASARVLGSAIRSAPTDERAAYVFALGFLGLTDALDAGVAATLDEDATVRGCAAYALAAIGSIDAAKSVERLLVDEHEVREWNCAPWRTGTRVKHLANAALTGALPEPFIKAFPFPSKLSKGIASRNSNDLE